MMQQPIDWEEFHHRVDGRIALLDKLLTMVLDVIPPRRDALATAISNGDTEEAFKVAHQLNGALGTIAAKKAATLAGCIEKASRCDDIDLADQLFNSLATELTEVTDVAHRYLDQSTQSPPSPGLSTHDQYTSG